MHLPEIANMQTACAGQSTLWRAACPCDTSLGRTDVVIRSKLALRALNAPHTTAKCNLTCQLRELPKRWQCLKLINKLLCGS